MTDLEDHSQLILYHINYWEDMGETELLYILMGREGSIAQDVRTLVAFFGETLTHVQKDKSNGIHCKLVCKVIE